jgi:hypothetical protein
MFDTMYARGSRKSSNTTSSVATPVFMIHTTSRGVMVRAAGRWFSIAWNESRMFALRGYPGMSASKPRPAPKRTDTGSPASSR